MKMNENEVLARPQWIDGLEELAQCPVCFELPIGQVPMCLRGHHLCQRCKERTSCCPSCRSDFSKARNFAIENLCIKLSNVSLMSCRIGSCKTTLPVDPLAERMYRHVRDCHQQNFIKVNRKQHSCGSSCSKIWQLEYKLDRAYDFALHAEELGLFFVKLNIDKGGNLLVSVQIANSQQVNKFHYESSLFVPSERLPIICEGMVHVCSNTKIEYSDALRYDKEFFCCDYFKQHFVTLNDCTKPFTLALYIYHY